MNYLKRHEKTVQSMGKMPSLILGLELNGCIRNSLMNPVTVAEVREEMDKVCDACGAPLTSENVNRCIKCRHIVVGKGE